MRQRATQEESVGPVPQRTGCHPAEGHRFCGGHTGWGVIHGPYSYSVATRGSLSPWVKWQGHGVRHSSECCTEFVMHGDVH